MFIKRILAATFAVALSLTAMGADKVAKDLFVGYYEGQIENSPQYPINATKKLCAEVFRNNEGYRIRFVPAILTRCETFKTIANLKAENGEISFDEFAGEAAAKASKGAFMLAGKVTPEAIVAEGKMGGKDVKINLARSKFVPPTLGNPAPAGSVVLFDGTNTDSWIQKDGAPCRWTFQDGVMSANVKVGKNGKKIRSGNLFSKASFGAVRLHLEFRIPPSYDCPLYNRGNSGLYFGDYEIQIIDSFGGSGDWGDCGAIYRTTPPHVNASLEPGAWQTYDVEFKPAEFADGRLVKFPTFTVYHNGIRVQNDEPALWPTVMHHPENFNTLHSQKNYKIMLQDHGFPVEYRNIWLVNL